MSSPILLPSYTEDVVLLAIEDLSKDYDGVAVLKHISATIKDIRSPGRVCGQLLSIIGPSGCGKTTLFRCIAGLELPTSGRVVLDNTNRAVLPGEVGVVAQDYPLFGHRTVFSNLMLAARQASKTEKDARDKVVAYLAEFDLTRQLNIYPAQLSGGQRQRVSILQQVLAASHVILMDEPFSGLDPLAKRKTIALIQKIANFDESNTIVIVTHDIASAVAASDHIWVLGRDHDTNGNTIPGAQIVDKLNLIDMGLAWHQEIERMPEFMPLVNALEERFATL
jgi:ABC-type nitrate/sulfonate/bicarbonate transport system ATPase subunit